MGKIKQAFESMKNTPPDRLAKIEYQSHILSIIGNLIVCIILISKGFWYIIFAFIFSFGVTYSQAVASYQKYISLKMMLGDSSLKNIEKSFTRSRDYEIKNRVGFWGRIIAFLGALVLTYFIIGFGRWYWNILFTVVFLVLYLFIYFYPIYCITKLIRRKK